MYAPYTDGVVNQDGEQVIRPMTQDELDWLNKFNKEFVGASFNNDSTDLHHELIEGNKKALKKLKKALKQVSGEIIKVDNGYRQMDSEQRLEYKEYRKELFIKKNGIVAELEKVNIKGTIEKGNYSRSVDVSNSARTVCIGDLPTGNFSFTEESDPDINTSLESELFDRLKHIPIVED